MESDNSLNQQSINGSGNNQTRVGQVNGPMFVGNNIHIPKESVPDPMPLDNMAAPLAVARFFVWLLNFVTHDSQKSVIVLGVIGGAGIVLPFVDYTYTKVLIVDAGVLLWPVLIGAVFLTCALVTVNSFCKSCKMFFVQRQELKERLKTVKIHGVKQYRIHERRVCENCGQAEDSEYYEDERNDVRS